MKFSLFLFALSLILKFASLTNTAFKKYKNEVTARILIKTEDGKCARFFVFEKGKYSSLPGDHIEFDVALVWRDANTGFSVMTDKTEDAALKAMAVGKLKILGMSVYAKWFENGIKLAMGDV